MKVVKNEFGFYSIEVLPSEVELRLFYENKYFQENNGNYEKNYSKDELIYFENAAKVSDFILKRVNLKKEKRRIIDVGCGEGFFSKYFYDKHDEVTPIDFSEFGIKSQNPELYFLLIKGNIFETLDNIIKRKETFDFVNLSNVLEHVIEPIKLLSNLKKILAEDSLLRICVPNDFSVFQEFLLKKEYTTNTWLTPPEHLHYFSLNSLVKLLEYLGYEIELSLGDFPIELFLANEKSNYVKNKEYGKNAHLARVEIDNFLFNQGVEKYIQFYNSSLSLNFSRQIIIFARVKKEIL